MEKKKRVIRGIGDALAYLIGRPSKVETKKELETSQKTEEEVKKEDGQER